jgi:hypothetical protein
MFPEYVRMGFIFFLSLSIHPWMGFIFLCLSLFTRGPPVCIHSCTPVHTPSDDSNNSDDVDVLAELLAPGV